mmetsp:Transcript_19637/g.75380  ORF Transcript_19637/g.75380 Transcript_19637/m.75380 type:complete len:287 (+) Transcript_19637:968-1828(+)
MLRRVARNGVLIAARLPRLAVERVVVLLWDHCEHGKVRRAGRAGKAVVPTGVRAPRLDLPWLSDEAPCRGVGGRNELRNGEAALVECGQPARRQVRLGGPLQEGAGQVPTAWLAWVRPLSGFPVAVRRLHGHDAAEPPAAFVLLFHHHHCCGRHRELPVVHCLVGLDAGREPSSPAVPGRADGKLGLPERAISGPAGQAAGAERGEPRTRRVFPPEALRQVGLRKERGVDGCLALLGDVDLSRVGQAPRRAAAALILSAVARPVNGCAGGALLGQTASPRRCCGGV